MKMPDPQPVRRVVTVSRQWNNPQIMTTVVVTPEGGISLEMALDDFKEALLAELGQPVGILTKQQLRAKIDVAFQNIVRGIKDESVKVM